MMGLLNGCLTPSTTRISSGPEEASAVLHFRIQAQKAAHKISAGLNTCWTIQPTHETVTAPTFASLRFLYSRQSRGQEISGAQRPKVACVITPKVCSGAGISISVAKPVLLNRDFVHTGR